VKVVLFCGGLGLRLRDHASSAPKPMLTVGYRPILWHIMKYYAHYGHRDFILCLGYKADVLKDYFLNYDEAISNDFVLTDSGRSVKLLSSDISEWRITFADTGLHTKIGQRLRAVRKYLAGEEAFLASYGDCLTDAPLPMLLDDFGRRGKVGAFLSVPANYPFHIVRQREDGLVSSFQDVKRSDIWINGGYFIFRPSIFDYLGEGEELVEEPFQRLITDKMLITYPYKGFWAPMDTLKDREMLEDLNERGSPPWAVWERQGSEAAQGIEAHTDARRANLVLTSGGPSGVTPRRG
jgi:glucose-1-phosphate cytidylyltransferase